MTAPSKEVRDALIPTHNPDLIITKQVKGIMDAIGKLVDTASGGLNGYPVLLVGHAGVGKNQCIGEVANARSQPLIKINCSGDMRASSLLGRIAPTLDGKFEWQDGLLIEALKYGYWLDLDEINSLDADILFAIHGLCDDGFITVANNSSIVKAHHNFRIFATMNPTSYYGVKTLNQALIDRFAVIEVGFDEGVDKKLVEQLNAPKDVQISLLSLIGNIRKAYEEGEITQNFGHRTLHNVVKLSKQFDVLDALNMAYSNKLPESERASVKTMFKDLATLVTTFQKSTQGGKGKAGNQGSVGQDGMDIDAMVKILSDAKKK